MTYRYRVYEIRYDQLVSTLNAQYEEGYELVSMIPLDHIGFANYTISVVFKPMTNFYP
jgi:hypothetical protein